MPAGRRVAVDRRGGGSPPRRRRSARARSKVAGVGHGQDDSPRRRSGAPRHGRSIARASGPAPRRPRWYRAARARPRLYVTDAIVLSRFDYGEADRILTLLTPELGKIKAIAKGIRRPTSRIGGALEPLAELRLQLARGRTFDVVTQVRDAATPGCACATASRSTATAWYCAELADRSLEERHAAEPLYLLLRRAYELLDAAMAPGRVARWFEMRLCDELGVRPEVDRCVECGRLARRRRTMFAGSRRSAGSCATRHGGPSQAAAGLSTTRCKVLKAYQRMDVEAIAGLRLPPAVEARGGAVLRRVRPPRHGARRPVAPVPRGGPARTTAATSRPSPTGRPAQCSTEDPMIDPTTKAGARAAERLRATT